jgi:error-prone DNA polymerase
MGFYSPSMLIQDARRHGVTVLPVDVAQSDWESRVDETGAVRLGLREIRGLAAEKGQKIAVDRKIRAFSSIADLTLRCGLGKRELEILAAADALQSLAGHRRQAAWQVADSALHPGKAMQGDLFAGLDGSLAADLETPGESVSLPAPSLGENLVADYRHVGHSLRAHPLSLLRQTLRDRRFLCARDLPGQGDKALVRVAGIVTGRQRPGTATGIVFVTLEDESGWINVVVNPQLVERQRRELLAAQLLGIYGQLQQAEGVTHVFAQRLVDLSGWLGQLETHSRDFH